MSKDTIVLGCITLFAIGAVVFGAIVEISKGIAWIRWAFG